jgi:hypothetical protein
MPGGSRHLSRILTSSSKRGRRDGGIFASDAPGRGSTRGIDGRDARQDGSPVLKLLFGIEQSRILSESAPGSALHVADERGMRGWREPRELTTHRIVGAGSTP